MKDKKLLEVSMMLGDAIKKLDALSAYKPLNTKAQNGVEKIVDDVDEVIADIALRDNGKIFWKSIDDSDLAVVCQGDLRKILTAIHQFDEVEA